MVYPCLTAAPLVAHIGSWVGPSGARQDFQWLRRSDEVKTTSPTRGHIHTINGLDQLGPFEDGELYIFSPRTRAEAPGKQYLLFPSSRASRANWRATPTRETSSGRGWPSRDISRSTMSTTPTARYRVVDELLYIVSAGFPRPSPSLFQEGLGLGLGGSDMT